MTSLVQRAKRARFHDIIDGLNWPDDKMSRKEAMKIKAKEMTFGEIYREIDRDPSYGSSDYNRDHSRNGGQLRRTAAIWLRINPNQHWRVLHYGGMLYFMIAAFAFQAIVMSAWHALK